MKNQISFISIIFLIATFFSLGVSGQKSSEGSNSVRYLNPIFENVDIMEDVPFGESVTIEGLTETLLLDVYTPAGDNQKKRPAIMWIHGGGFRKGNNDKQQSYIVSMANAYTRRGYVCFSINYRVRDDPRADITGTISDALEDAMVGLQWVKANSKKYNIDKKKIIVGGGSAGGIIAVNLCYKDETKDEKWDKSGVIGLVDLWGSPNKSWSTATIDANDPPTIIVHGTLDDLVPFSNSEELVAELKQAGVKHELVPIVGEGHTPASHMDEFNKNISQFLFELINSK
jgi:acetyl esterase/lipase